jgi:hypothetical protein
MGHTKRMTKKISLTKLILIAISLFLLSSCASHYQDANIYDPYGFFSGLWHGFVFPISFFGWLFIDNVYVIGQPNTGGTYFLGFIIGALCILGVFSENN